MGGFGIGMVLLVLIGTMPLLMALAAGRPAAPPKPRPKTRPDHAPGRKAPPDLLLDTDLDPGVEPWSDDPPVRRR